MRINTASGADSTPTDDRDGDADDGLRTRSLLGIKFAQFASTELAAAKLATLVGLDRSGITVHTCNVDHVMLMQRDPSFAQAYSTAGVVTADGAPLVALAHLLGRSIGPRITGADLVPALASQAEQRGLRMALVGGTQESVHLAARRLRELHPGLRELLAIAPPMGLEIGSPADQDVVQRIREARSHLIVVGLGAPKQELWMHQHCRELPGTVLIGAGASIDFLSGRQKRAPRLLQVIGLEWLYRLATDFRRLWRRYLVRDLGLALVLLRHGLHAIRRKQ
jgi:N-acetylglucosaminyldiphosphoundecaprenol N-acetyl-beta-D-mannosaminyltransferase